MRDLDTCCRVKVADFPHTVFWERWSLSLKKFNRGIFGVLIVLHKILPHRIQLWLWFGPYNYVSNFILRHLVLGHHLLFLLISPLWNDVVITVMVLMGIVTVLIRMIMVVWVLGRWSEVGADTSGRPVHPLPTPWPPWSVLATNDRSTSTSSSPSWLNDNLISMFPSPPQWPN